MYKEHFSFKQKPFELTPNPDFLFLSSAHKKAITYLDYGIKEKTGFILLTGEIGAGKTTIVRNMIKTLPGKIRLSRVTNTKVSSEQLISMINEDFGLEVQGKSKTTLLSELNESLIEQYSKDLQPVLLVDEAQNLTADLLEEIRLLSNLETDKAKLLQIILVGQPELKKTLELPALVQLRQRITINFHITPLTTEEIGQYIKHRLTVAGNPDAFNIKEDMLEAIHQFSRGIPRLINILCDFALLATYVEGKEEVGIDIVEEVINDLKSYNYWNESEGETPVAKDAPVEQGRDSDFLKITGELITRLIKLEEALSGFKDIDISVLSEKVARLEEEISKISEAANNNHNGKSDELSGRLSRVEKMLAGIGGSPVIWNSGGKADPLKDEVESIKKMLNYVDSKLRNHVRYGT